MAVLELEGGGGVPLGPSLVIKEMVSEFGTTDAPRKAGNKIHLRTKFFRKPGSFLSPRHTLGGVALIWSFISILNTPSSVQETVQVLQEMPEDDRFKKVSHTKHAEHLIEQQKSPLMQESLNLVHWTEDLTFLKVPHLWYMFWNKVALGSTYWRHDYSDHPPPSPRLVCRVDRDSSVVLVLGRTQ
ncbi:hypothetical protein C5167_041692 [Papaver somniferum]|nr:hypothetical protein C5167_041692 [Papaver somniferum]